MNISLNEKQYQDLARLLYQATNVRGYSKEVEKKSKQLLDEYNILRKKDISGDRITLNTDKLHHVVNVLSKFENKDYSKETIRQAGNVLRQLEEQRVNEKPSWQLADLNKQQDWSKIHENIVKIGMTEMDYRAAEKVLRDISEGKADDLTQTISTMTEKVFDNYLKEGNDPYKNYEMKVNPELFARISDAMKQTYPPSEKDQERASNLLKELNMERTFDLRDRDSKDIIEKIIQYLAEMVSKLRDIVFDKQPQSESVVEPIDDKFSGYVQNMFEEIRKGQMAEVDPSMHAYVNKAEDYVLHNADRAEWIDQAKNTFEQEIRGNIKEPQLIDSFTKGAVVSVLNDERIGFEEKNHQLQGLLRASFDLSPEPLKEKNIQVTEQEENQQNENTSKEKEEERLTLRQVLFEKIGDKLPGNIPIARDLNKPVTDYRIKGNLLWFKTDNDFKAIKLHEGPHNPEERRDIMSKALYGEGAEQTEAKNEIKKVVKQLEVLEIKEIQR